MKKLLILLALLVMAVAVVFALLRTTNSVPSGNPDANNTTTEDPLDATLAFLNQWLEAELSTSTDPVTAGLLELPILSAEAKAYIEAGDITLADQQLSPVFCQSVTPERLGGKVLYATPSDAQVIVLARGLEEKSPFQSIVTLAAKDGKWQIANISCSQGEVAPVREFDFERTGFLLKSVPPPLNSDFWHLVYEENGVMGHTVPLSFTDSSVCVSAEGVESACNQDSFSEPSEVTLKADMTESGAIVRRLEF